MKAHELTSEVLKLIASKVKVGISTKKLDEMAEAFIRKNGGTPYNKGYHPQYVKTAFPGTLCTSVNDQIAHGIPSDYILQDGDLINLDVGVYMDGFCGDAALTVGIGNISEKDQALLNVAKGALFAGISRVRDGVRVSDIGSAMNKYCEQHGYVTNRVFCGHRIAEEMHMKPDIPNYYHHNNFDILRTGMVVCIEPQVTKKDRMGRMIGDWDYRTRDGKKSAFFEHMIEVLDDGYKILTTHI